jgi:hypothetical protein
MRYYLAFFDGLRGYYCRFPNERSAAGLSAASALAFIASIFVAAAVMLVAVMLGGAQLLVRVTGPYRWWCLPIGLLIQYAHVKWAKSTGLYESKGPVSDPSWRRPFVLYVSLTGLVLVSALVSVYISH